MKIEIFKEKTTNYIEIEQLINFAFKDLPYSNQKENLLVSNIRNSDSYINELALVAKINEEIVGHILLSKISLLAEKIEELLCLGPVSVLPSYQRKGVGSSLINYAVKKAAEMNYKAILVIGDKEYYKKFGFIEASNYNIKLNLDFDMDLVLIRELSTNHICKNGIIKFPSCFYDEAGNLI